jgi:hypothetical protein
MTLNRFVILQYLCRELHSPAQSPLLRDRLTSPCSRRSSSFSCCANPRFGLTFGFFSLTSR